MLKGYSRFVNKYAGPPIMLAGSWREDFNLVELAKIGAIERVYLVYAVAEHRGSQLNVEDRAARHGSFPHQGDPSIDHVGRNRQE